MSNSVARRMLSSVRGISYNLRSNSTQTAAGETNRGLFYRLLYIIAYTIYNVVIIC